MDVMNCLLINICPSSIHPPPQKNAVESLGYYVTLRTPQPGIIILPFLSCASSFYLQIQLKENIIQTGAHTSRIWTAKVICSSKKPSFCLFFIFLMARLFKSYLGFPTPHSQSPCIKEVAVSEFALLTCTPMAKRESQCAKF